MKDCYRRRAIRITGRDGTEIVHRAYNVDQERFFAKAKRRLRGKVLES